MPKGERYLWCLVLLGVFHSCTATSASPSRSSGRYKHTSVTERSTRPRPNRFKRYRQTSATSRSTRSSPKRSLEEEEEEKPEYVPQYNATSATALHTRFTRPSGYESFTQFSLAAAAVATILSILALRKFCTMRFHEEFEVTPSDTECSRVLHRNVVFEFTHLKKQQVAKYGQNSILGSGFSLPTLLRPPNNIDEEKGWAVKEACMALLENQAISVDDFNPEVFICFDTGGRSGDAEPYGPGVFYAAAITKFLYEHDVPCYSSNMLPVGIHPRVFVPNIKERFSRCRVLIAIETKAMYQSTLCLQELFSAVENNIDIAPVRFGPTLPGKNEQWSHIKPDEPQYSMVSTVQKKLSALKRIPEPPGTIPVAPGQLEKVFDFVASKIGEKTVKTLASGATRRSLTSSPSEGSRGTKGSKGSKLTTEEKQQQQKEEANRRMEEEESLDEFAVEADDHPLEQLEEASSGSPREKKKALRKKPSDEGRSKAMAKKPKMAPTVAKVMKVNSATAAMGKANRQGIKL